MVQVSPGVAIQEIDISTTIATVSTSIGAIAGVFSWGPLAQVQMIDSEASLLSQFGRPSNFNPETWFTAASFLSYANALNVVRAGDYTGNTVTASFAGTISSVSNNVLILANSSVGNTADLSAGMVLAAASVSGLPIGATISSVNSTAVVMSAPASANVSGASLMFRDNVLYTASGLQSDLNYTMLDVQDWDNQAVLNSNDYSGKEANGWLFDVASLYLAKYPGAVGNSLRVSVCDSYDQFKSNTALVPNSQINATASVLTGVVGQNSLTITIAPANTANTTQVASANSLAVAVQAKLSVGDLVEIGNTKIGYQFLKLTSVGTVSNFSNVYTIALQTDDNVHLSTNTNNGYVARYWEFHNSVDSAPTQSDYVFNFGNTSANDEVHVVVVDEDGGFTTSPGTILEVHRNLSRATDAKDASGSSIYYKNYINQNSRYIWWANDRTTAVSNTAAFVTSSTASVPLNMSFVGGGDGLDEVNVPFGTLALGYDLFQSTEDVDISLVLQGKARGDSVSGYSQLVNYLIDNIAEVRLDCVVFASPYKEAVVNNPNQEAAAIVAARANMDSSSYGFLDSGYKYMYDKYNDVYRWIPLNGDMAGLCARTDETNNAWWSPAGLNRGQIKNVVRLAYNPKQTDRDTLYKAGVNPVITSKGQGTYLFGDKTMLDKPSSFSRINVRRLFIVLEKAISLSAKYTLFEFNDDFTRAQFRNMVNPYLRTIKGARGIYDFLVVCDTTNNTPDIIDSNQFIGDIYIKPAKSINFITLRFINTPTGLDFTVAESAVISSSV